MNLSIGERQLPTNEMTAISHNGSRIISIVRWIARVWALALFLFWGLFFVEQTAEWFTQPNQWPPITVVLLHAAHFIFLVGLLLGWRWELIGGAVALAAATTFFPQVSGKNTTIFLWVSIVPALLWIGLGLRSLKRTPAPH